MRKFVAVLLAFLLISGQVSLAESPDAWDEWCESQSTEVLIYIKEKIEAELGKRTAFESSTGDQGVIAQKNFDDCTVKVIKVYTIAQAGADCLVVEYVWSHSKEEAAAFLYTLSTEAYQEGVQLTPYTLIDGSTNTATKIKPGVEYTSIGVFLLNNRTSTVTLDVMPFMDIGNTQGKISVEITLK